MKRIWSDLIVLRLPYGFFIACFLLMCVTTRVTMAAPFQVTPNPTGAAAAFHPEFKTTQHKLGANTLEIPDRFYFGSYDNPNELIVRMGWRSGDFLPITNKGYGIFVQIYISQIDQEDPRGEFLIQASHKSPAMEKKDFGQMKYVGTRTAGNYDLFYLPSEDSYVGCLRVDAPSGTSIGPPGSTGSYFSCDTVFRYKGNIFAWVKASYIMPSDVATSLIAVHDELATFIH